MTKRASASNFVAREVRESDEDALASFRCSTGPWYEEEVEDYINAEALRNALSSPKGYRLLTIFEGDGLVACGAHHPEALLKSDDTLLIATRIQMLAIDVEHQRLRLADGSRLSDLVMQTVIGDALRTRLTTVLTALVAHDNLRSQCLFERNGLRSQVEYDRRYLRLTGQFAAPG